LKGFYRKVSHLHYSDTKIKLYLFGFAWPWKWN